jgi:hypothetical protein
MVAFRNALQIAVESIRRRTKEAGGLNYTEMPGKMMNLTDSAIEATLLGESRRSGRAVECAGLENR